jgi:hypothetical protein
MGPAGPNPDGSWSTLELAGTMNDRSTGDENPYEDAGKYKYTLNGLFIFFSKKEIFLDTSTVYSPYSVPVLCNYIEAGPMCRRA